MGVYAGPDVSESGLVLALDAGNSKSYPDPVNYYSTPETLTDGRTGSTSGGNYTDFTSGGPDGGRFTRWTNDTGTSGSTAWHWAIDYTNTGLSTGQPVIISFYARCPNATVSNITLNSPDSVIVNATLDSTWRLFVGTALYGGDYVSTPSVRINRSNTSTFANGATYDIARLKIQKGNVLVDVTGRGNSGTLTNGPTYNSSNFGSIVFDGSNDGIQLPGTNLSLNQMTISSWNYSTNYNQNGFMFEKTTNNSVNTQYSLFFNGDNTIYYRTYGISPTGDLAVNTTSAGVVNNQWNNVVATFDGTNKRIYVNGVLAATSVTLSGTVTQNTTGAAYIGIYGNFAGYPFNGRISNTQIYNRSLTAAEIQQNFNALRGRYGI